MTLEQADGLDVSGAITREELVRAAMTVLAHADSDEEARMFLEMLVGSLGPHPGRRKERVSDT